MTEGWNETHTSRIFNHGFTLSLLDPKDHMVYPSSTNVVSGGSWDSLGIYVSPTSYQAM